MFWEMLWSEMVAHIWTELFELSLQGGLELTSDCWGEPTSVHTGMLGRQCGSHGAVAFLLLSSGFPHLPKRGRYVGACPTCPRLVQINACRVLSRAQFW